MVRHYRIRTVRPKPLQTPENPFINPIMDKAIDPAALRLTQFSHGGG
jgi:hypothetical protein